MQQSEMATDGNDQRERQSSKASAPKKIILSSNYSILLHSETRFSKTPLQIFIRGSALPSVVHIKSFFECIRFRENAGLPAAPFHMSSFTPHLSGV